MSAASNIVKLAAVGNLDSTFGTEGKVTTDFSSSDTTASPPSNRSESMGSALQADGQIVVVGSAPITTSLPSSEIDVIVARYNKSDGSLDTTFGTGGERIDGKGDTTTSKAFAVAIQPSDGNIVVAGASDWLGTDSFMLRRYLSANGAPDNTIDGSGDVVTNFSGIGSLTISEANAVAIQADDGKIVLAGFVQNGGEFRDFAVARYCPTDGLLDDGSNCPGSREAGFDTAGNAGTSLSFDGTIVTAIGLQTEDIAHAVAVNPRSHKIVVVGESDTTFAMVQYNEDGTPDTTGFGSNGIVTNGLVGPGFGVVIQADDKIVVVGTKSVTVPNSPNCIGSLGHACEQLAFYVARYNSDGSPDSGFGIGGAVTTAMNSQGNNDQAFSIVIRPADGKIIVAGYTDEGISTFLPADPWITYHPARDFALARYTATGELDSSFGTGGKLTTDFFGSLDDQGHSVLIQPDSKIVVAGYNDTHNFVLVRYGIPGTYLPLVRK